MSGDRCFLGELNCSVHPVEMPGYDASPPAGICTLCHEVASRLWLIPRWDKYACIGCLRGAMRRATWPWPFTFPE